MAETPFTEPVDDTVEKVDDTVAVGEDLAFQERWWKFEHAIWIVFGLILMLDLLGVFGKGVVANAHKRTVDGSLDVKYERIERNLTPSSMMIKFGPSAVEHGKIFLFVSESLIQDLGAQRIAPQPCSSVVGDGGITYTWPATASPGAVTISLEPSPGVHRFTIGIPGGETINERVVVVP